MNHMDHIIPELRRELRMVSGRKTYGYSVWLGKVRLCAPTSKILAEEFMAKKVDEIFAPASKIRPCISCSKEFESQGAHNRFCDECRFLSRGVEKFRERKPESKAAKAEEAAAVIVATTPPEDLWKGEHIIRMVPRVHSSGHGFDPARWVEDARTRAKIMPRGRAAK